MQIILCPSFEKQLKKIKSVSVDDLKKLLKKHPHTDKIVSLKQLDQAQVIKCYLFQNKVRCIIFLKRNFQYLPIAIVRKETKQGKNITKDNFFELFGGEMDKIIEEFDNDIYRIEEL